MSPHYRDAGSALHGIPELKAAGACCKQSQCLAGLAA